MDLNSVVKAASKMGYTLQTTTAQHQQLLGQSITGLEKRIISRFKALETAEDGSLLGMKTNLKQAQKIQTDLNRAFIEEYGTTARQATKGYGSVAKAIQQSWEEDLGMAVVYTGADKEMMAALQLQSYNEFLKFGTAAQERIAKAMYDAVAGQTGFFPLVSEISASLTGQLAKNGRPLSTYAEMYANDAIMNFHQAVSLTKSADLGMDYFLYVGNVMNTSRPFCIERVGDVFSREEINKWNFDWQGKSGPALTHRGGYNCRHHWQAIKEDWLDEVDYGVANRRVESYMLAMDELTPFGVKPGSKGAKFVEALIEKPMTNAEIKALSWNATGNLHGDIFKKLKDKGLAGTTKDGKKWIKGPTAQFVEVAEDTGDILPKTDMGILEKIDKAADSDGFVKTKIKSGSSTAGTVQDVMFDSEVSLLDNVVDVDIDPNLLVDPFLDQWNKQALKSAVKDVAGGDDVAVIVKYNDEYIIDTGADLVEVQLMQGKKKIKALMFDLDEHITNELQAAADDIIEELEELTTKDVVTKLTAQELGYKPGTAKAKFVDALLEKPMTNTEIKALDWNTSGNLHGDVFKELKEKGYAGITNGKKWISINGKAPSAIFDDIAEEVAEEIKASPLKKTIFPNVKHRVEVAADEAQALMDQTNTHFASLGKKYKGLGKWADEAGETGGLRLEPGTHFGPNSALGKYNPNKKTITLGAGQDLEHTLNIGYGNVVEDFYGAARHEYGHHLYDNTNLKQMWEAQHNKIMLSSKGKNPFTGVSNYATTSIEEAFTESFAAYTSPLYKKGMLDKSIENFFDHVLKGQKLKEIKVPKPKLVKSGQPVKFRSKNTQKVYDQEYSRYRQMFDQVAATGSPGATKRNVRQAARRQWDKDIRGTWMSDSLSSWQGSTRHSAAMKLKIKAELLEAKDITIRVSNHSSTSLAKIHMSARKAEDMPYLQARAMTQAYYDSIGVKKVRLHRGIGGDTGHRMRGEISRIPKTEKVLLKEDAIVGYSSDRSIADNFGRVALTRNMDVKDILFSDDIWIKTGYEGEKEFIVLAGNYEVPRSSMWLT